MSYRYAREPKNSDLFAYDWIWKIVVTGDSGVGKSSFVSYYSKGVFPQNQSSTVGIQYEEKKIEIYEKIVKLQIWDTAGQERFRSLVKSYYRGACGVLLMYDVTNRRTFDNCGSWLNDLAEQAENRIVVALIGNKTDLIGSNSDGESKKREVSVDEAWDFAKRNHLFFMETSAKNGSNVDDVFYAVTKELIKTYQVDAGIENSVDIMRYNTLNDYAMKTNAEPRRSSSSDSSRSSLRIANEKRDGNEESAISPNLYTLSNKYERKNLRNRNDPKFATKEREGERRRKEKGNVELKSANENSSTDDQCNPCY
jgi:small GTP-binding protein